MLLHMAARVCVCPLAFSFSPFSVLSLDFNFRQSPLLSAIRSRSCVSSPAFLTRSVALRLRRACGPPRAVGARDTLARPEGFNINSPNSPSSAATHAARQGKARPETTAVDVSLTATQIHGRNSPCLNRLPPKFALHTAPAPVLAHLRPPLPFSCLLLLFLCLLQP